jgi:nitrite reductase/ring-hydroxylating ferredoxin subunit
MARWRVACRLEDVAEGEPATVTVDGIPLGIFRLGDACHAIHDICTHEFALLSQGYQEGDVIECPLHQARFSITTGKCLGAPADKDVAVYPTRIDGSDILVELPD